MLRSVEHGGNEDGAWVLLESVGPVEPVAVPVAAPEAAPGGAAEGVAAAAVE